MCSKYVVLYSSRCIYISLCTNYDGERKQQTDTLAADDSDAQKTDRFEYDISTENKKVKTWKNV